jgi:hypothetical protein
MVIAAVAVIVFSLLGIASMRGWVPHALVSSEAVDIASARGTVTTDAVQGPAFGCAECGVIQSLRGRDEVAPQ